MIGNTEQWRHVPPSLGRFTGKEPDVETGLDYFGARYFSGAMGRFLSADLPLYDQDAADPLSWNLFSYVRNNPVRYIDPTGRGCVSTQSGHTSTGIPLWTNTSDTRVPGPSCGEIDKADQNASPTVTVSLDRDELRLMVLAVVGQTLSSAQAWGSITRGAMENAYPLASTIVECAARGIGGNCNSGDEVLYAGVAKPKIAQAAARVARLWTITKPAATKVFGGRTYLKDAKTTTWWSRETAGHGGSVWKVYEEKGGKLEWIADADAHGTFISGKHKSPIGKLVK